MSDNPDQPDPHPLIRLFLEGLAVGVAVSALLVAALFWFDVGGMGTLIGKSGQALTILIVLWVSQIGFFAALHIGWRVMGMRDKDGD